MASHVPTPSLPIFIFLLALAAAITSPVDAAGNFTEDVIITSGDGRGKILNDGELITLSLDKISGSAFQSRKAYLYCQIDTQIKLPAGNSAGTITSYYLSSQGATHYEIGFMFVGNLAGDQFVVSTNVVTQGIRNREMRFHLWFDPTKDFHTYSILWNPTHIVFYVDVTPIREFRKTEGVPYPESQAMRLYANLSNSDDWAAGGRPVTTDWTQSPFTASFRSFAGVDFFGDFSFVTKPWMEEALDGNGLKKMQWAQKNFMVYDYCSDVKGHPQQRLPAECTAR
ncbi:Brassinosteroid-regulated protein BRU1 [Apostasia shenzhenica]|uniref:Xyloglucan endotransglucosylase/hydrolase n=1 Tax=Apostasia shenzhenica TaxID=1088818 RepID=A0A2I0A766_9ASPA|nr:Brassinosteroid-regulated protein BRU1 [Apostasia shenzhenica]